MKFTWQALTVLSLAATALAPHSFAAAGEAACAAPELQPAGDTLTWLKTRAQPQLDQIFDCAQPSSGSGIPLGLGHGFGSIYADAPLWNQLQDQIGLHIWGGKRFFQDGATVRLINEMVDSGVERYRAVVYVSPSIRDGLPTIVLDYRGDDSAATLGQPGTPVQVLVDKIAPGIRDEIREIVQDGQPTHVFVGRAYLYKKVLAPNAFIKGDLGFPVNDADFANPDRWLMVANFYLDFR